MKPRLPVPIEHGPRDRRLFALTFDADISNYLPSSRATERAEPHREILDLLRSRRVPATLFLTGRWAELHPTDARRLGGEPLFEIGNHSYSHLAFAGPCYGLPVLASDRQKRVDVLRGANVIAAATGRVPSFFRFPGGCYAASDVELVRSLGEEPVQWDVLSGDAFDFDVSSVAQRVLEGTRPGSIVVMHLSEPQRSVAADVLRIVLPELHAKDLTPVALPALLGAPGSSLQMPGARRGLTILPELDRVYARMLEAGYPTRIAGGLRTIDAQIALYAKGRAFPEFRDALEQAVADGSVTRETADRWIAHFDPKASRHQMPPGELNAEGVSQQVTWTLRSRHLTGDAADVVHETLGWNAPHSFWEALRTAVEAEGLRIGPPAHDRAHVQRA